MLMSMPIGFGKDLTHCLVNATLCRRPSATQGSTFIYYYSTIGGCCSATSSHVHVQPGHELATKCLFAELALICGPHQVW